MVAEVVDIRGVWGSSEGPAKHRYNFRIYDRGPNDEFPFLSGHTSDAAKSFHTGLRRRPPARLLCRISVAVSC